MYATHDGHTVTVKNQYGQIVCKITPGKPVLSATVNGDIVVIQGAGGMTYVYNTKAQLIRRGK